MTGLVSGGPRAAPALCLFVSVLTFALTPARSGTARGAALETQTGESLVLAGMEPGHLFRGRVVRGSVVVRSTYLAGLPHTVVYAEGRD